MFPPAGPAWHLRLTGPRLTGPRLTGPRLTGPRGSMAVEMVIAVPGFLLLLLLIAGGANWVSASSQVGSAARDAARAASLARSGEDADTAATTAAQYDLGTLCSGGGPTVSVVPLGGVSFADATEVSVTVKCPINLQVFKIVGLDNPHPFSSVSIAPLDPFVARMP